MQAVKNRKPTFRTTYGWAILVLQVLAPSANARIMAG
jgi:hypothetical protein